MLWIEILENGHVGCNVDDSPDGLGYTWDGTMLDGGGIPW